MASGLSSPPTRPTPRAVATSISTLSMSMEAGSSALRFIPTLTRSRCSRPTASGWCGPRIATAKSRTRRTFSLRIGWSRRGYLGCYTHQMSRLVLVLTAALALTASAAAQATTWQIDPNHTAAQFSVRHLGISTVSGAFTKVSGSVTYDPTNPGKTVIDVTIDANSVDTRVERRDNDLRSPNFFDAAKFPTLTFKSKRTEADGPGKLKVTGDLTIHAVPKDVEVVQSPPPAK